jgi:hypothetical protein
MRAYHLLSEKYALDDLRQRRLKVSRLEDMNDPFELLGIRLKKKEHRDAMRGFKADMDRFCGALCFSRSWGHPMIWSHYADKHRGICLGFDVPEDKAIPISYNAERLEFDLERQLSKATRDEKLGLKLLTTKFEGWKYEDEVRLVVSIENETTLEAGMHFFNFGPELKLREVIVGARSTLTREALQDALSPEDRGARMVKARLAFRTFTVVKQRNEKLWK